VILPWSRHLRRDYVSSDQSSDALPFPMIGFGGQSQGQCLLSKSLGSILTKHGLQLQLDDQELLAVCSFQMQTYLLSEEGTYSKLSRHARCIVDRSSGTSECVRMNHCLCAMYWPKQLLRPVRLTPHCKPVCAGADSYVAPPTSCPQQLHLDAIPGPAAEEGF